MVWTLEKERRARAHATSAQHDSAMGKADMKTAAKMYGRHQEGHECEWNGEGC